MGFLNSGGAIIEGAKGAVIGGVTGAATYNIGHGSGGKHVVGSNVVAQAATHGVVQGVISEASGGNFRTGFIGGATGHVAGKATQGVMQGDTTAAAVAARTSIAAIFGGTAAEATGGKFAQGAYHAAMVHLFNGEFAQKQSEIIKTQNKDSILYERGNASVLVKNDVPGGGIPQVSAERISHALDVSAQEAGVRVNIISGYRGPNHQNSSINHEKYNAIDVYIEGYDSTQTARSLYKSGYFHRTAGYPNSNLKSAHGDDRTTRKGGCFVYWKGPRC